MEEGEPIEHRLITRAIANAQSKVEAHNFDIRKHLLEYDDVMNKQREVIYARRREVLGGETLKRGGARDGRRRRRRRRRAVRARRDAARRVGLEGARRRRRSRSSTSACSLPEEERERADRRAARASCCVERVHGAVRRARAGLHAAGHAPPREVRAAADASTRCGRTICSPWIT